MSELNQQAPKPRRNPLTWIAIVVVGLILFVFLGGDRRDARLPGSEEDTEVIVTEDPVAGTIERSLLVPPGMRARQYIAQIRDAGKPYPLDQVHDKAQNFLLEGSLADAHLLYFFAARENHLASMMMMALLSDPILFQPENSLLDQPDAIQAYKWYSKAAELGEPTAAERVDQLRQWADDAAATGDPEARQLLLKIQ